MGPNARLERGFESHIDTTAEYPKDLFEAFRDLVDNGMPAADIAARFGKTEAHVVKILKLARVSPKILKDYRPAVTATVIERHARVH